MVPRSLRCLVDTCGIWTGQAACVAVRPKPHPCCLHAWKIHASIQKVCVEGVPWCRLVDDGVTCQLPQQPCRMLACLQEVLVEGVPWRRIMRVPARLALPPPEEALGATRATSAALAQAAGSQGLGTGSALGGTPAGAASISGSGVLPASVSVAMGKPVGLGPAGQVSMPRSFYTASAPPTGFIADQQRSSAPTSNQAAQHMSGPLEQVPQWQAARALLAGKVTALAAVAAEAAAVSIRAGSQASVHLTTGSQVGLDAGQTLEQIIAAADLYQSEAECLLCCPHCLSLYCSCTATVGAGSEKRIALHLQMYAHTGGVCCSA